MGILKDLEFNISLKQYFYLLALCNRAKNYPVLYVLHISYAIYILRILYAFHTL